MKKIFSFMLGHKFISLIILSVLIAGGYFGYQKISTNKENAVRYVTQAVEKGTLISSISGTGQVSASNQVDIKSKASGDVVYVGVEKGQEVEAGTLLVQVDSRSAQRAVRDAATALETAKLELEELLQPVDAYSLMQAENSLTQAKDSLTKLKLTQERNYQNTQEAIQKAEDNLKKAYEDGFNSVANVFLDLPTLMAGLGDILYGNTINSKQYNILVYNDMVKNYDENVLQYKDETAESYHLAREEYEQNFQDYKAVSRYSAIATIEALINKSYETNRDIAEAIKDANNLIDFVRDTLTKRNLNVPAIISTHQSNLQTYTSKTNSFLSSLLSVQRSIEDNKASKLDAEQDLRELDQNNPLDLAAAERSVKEKEESLAKLKSGPDELDIRAKKISIQQKEDALLTAQQNLADH